MVRSSPSVVVLALTVLYLSRSLHCSSKNNHKLSLAIYVQGTIWRETLVVGKFGELSAELHLVTSNLANSCMEHAPCNYVSSGVA